MNTLPSDLIVVVAGYLDIDSFLSFRRTCRRYKELINSHVNGLVTAVAESTFPDHKRMLESWRRAPKGTPKQRISQLKWLRYQHMATIMLENRRNSRGDTEGLAAEDPLGDDIRATGAHGWHVLAHLAKIAHDVRQRPEHDLPARYHDGGDAQRWYCVPHTNMDLKHAVEIGYQWLRLIESLTFEELRAYKWLSKAITHDVFGYPKPLPRSNQKPEPDAKSWVMTYVAMAGPELFWKQWRANDASNEDRENRIKIQIESSRQNGEDIMPRFEIDPSRVVQRAVVSVQTHVRSVLLRSYHEGELGGRRNNESELRQQETLYPGQRVHERKLKTRAGELEPQTLFHGIHFRQDLDWKTIGCDIETLFAADERRRIRKEERIAQNLSSTNCSGMMRFPPYMRVSPEFGALLAQWEDEWLQGCNIDE